MSTPRPDRIVIRWSRLLFAMGVSILAFPLCAGDEASLALTWLGPEARVLTCGEMAIAWPAGSLPADSNPCDPDDAALDAIVTSPAGEARRVAGFIFQDYTRALVGGREVLTARGKPAWRLRYTPRESGRHVIEVAARRGGTVVARGRTEVDVAPGAGRGFVRVEPSSRRYFRFDDGTPLFLNGLCCCWHGRRGTYDYDDWLAAYEKAGINYFRIWMWPIAFGIEWDRDHRLQYQLDRAWTVDRILTEAERRGISVMVCFDYHGMFEVKKDFFGGNNYWPRHPYNVANGGPCREQNDFFTSPEAAALYRKRLRYMVARWGSYRSVIAWQFFNEIDNVYRYLKHDDVIRWHRDMARHLRSIDPYDHLITTSLTGSSERPDFWRLDEMDYAQFHSYNAKRPADMTASVVTRFTERYHKPIFVGEYGTDWKGWKPEQDPYFRALHQAVWTGPMSGAAGTAMSWWWESIHTAGLYHHWSVLAKFLEGTAIATAAMEPARLASVGDRKLLTYGVATSREALCFFIDPAYDWPAGGREEKPKPFAGGKVRVSGLTDGDYGAAWWDTSKGTIIQQRSVTVANGDVVLDVPEFRVDVALRLQVPRK